MSNTSKWLLALALPFGVAGTWVAARVWAVMLALYGVGIAVVGKLVLMGLATVLGIAFAHVADAQGVSGFIYARDRYGSDRLVLRQAYEDLNRFGNDLYYLGRAYDGGVRAVLYDSRTQVFITYALTADSQNPGKDMMKATLNARNYNPNVPTMTQVFVGGFGGTLIGSTAGSMFATAYSFGGNTYKSPTGGVQQY